VIYHWCPEEDWTDAVDNYTSPSLAEEGFIHFSFLEQIARTATAIDRGRDGLVLLCVDDTDLDVVVEDSYNIGEKFPHVYGAIPSRSVMHVVPFPAEPDGSFRVPDGVYEPNR
jgi:uncharacterized protein (DUF952 family)